jgi:hypothetical protein
MAAPASAPTRTISWLLPVLDAATRRLYVVNMLNSYEAPTNVFVFDLLP